MTAPWMSYHHGLLDDCTTTTGWTETGTVGGDTATLTVIEEDIFDLNVTAVGGDGIMYWELNPTDISTTTFTRFLSRYRTSDASIEAKIELIFTAGTQTILDNSSSTSWALVDEEITTGKTLDKVRLYGNTATGNVYYDFILFYEGKFTFPYVNDLEQFEMENNNVFLDAPTRMGQIPQINGATSPTLTLSGTMDTGTGWGTPDGQKLYMIMENIHSEPWQWVGSDLINAKMTPERFLISKVAGSKNQRVWDLVLRKYDLSSGANAAWTVDSLSWLGL